MKTIKHKLLACTLFLAGFSFAQTKLEKTSQTIKVDKNVTLDLNTDYCTIELDTWNKDQIEIEAYIEGERLSKEELQEALKNWNLKVEANSKNVSITSKGNRKNLWSYQNSNSPHDVIIIQELKHDLADIPELAELPELIELPELTELPELPAIPEGISDINFDYDAYKKDSDKYLEQWSQKFEQKFGKEYEQKMEAWSKKYEEKMKAWEKKFEQKNEQRIKLAEKRAALIEERMKKREELNRKKEVLIEKRHSNRANLFYNSSDVKKTIKIRLPKKVKVKVNVRHGELNLASNVENLNATIAYTNFIANSINGNNTSINASYSPINISNWNYGKLDLNYVDHASLDNVKNILLSTNSSNVQVNNLTDNAIINSRFGDIKILNLSDLFNNINVTLENSNAIIKLPNTEHTFQFVGTQTKLKHPKNNNTQKTNSFSSGNINHPKKIIVNAKYSIIDMH
ncbi:hypothetical protein [Pseudofulvibacter geojedonensis]|uniref:Adhesin domain-containing protein n=1 Tax=Pseudofulvibacter geojedonensis TaxID=1123758 RepID=A0ABW3HYX5_9FLAO